MKKMNKYYFRIPVFPRVRDEDEDSENYDDYVLDTSLASNPNVLHLVADGWNSEGVHQYLDLTDGKNRGKTMGKGIIDSEAFVQDNQLIVEIETKKKLTKKQIVNLTEEISGQCSDGWGEGFEQQELYHDGHDMYVS